jgi:pimeloyl-ACP methyl ester carboxylesterase
MGRHLLAAQALAVGLVLGAYGSPALPASAQSAAAPASPPAIDEARFVSINGVEQWITIRGQDRRKPVLLVLHGGPGGSVSHMIDRMKPFERDFVLVQWDQRGAGRSLARASGQVDPKLDMAAMVADGVAVTTYLEAHLRRDRIVLLGWSWGSLLGVRMAEARPDLYAAFVGTGQAASAQPERDVWDYAYLLERTRAAGDKAHAELEAMGPPPWGDASVPGRMWRLSAPYRGPSPPMAEIVKAATQAPGWTPADLQSLSKGRAAYKETVLDSEIWKVDFAKLGQGLKVPVLLVQGERDVVAPTDHARRWLAALPQKRKALVVIPEAGHDGLLTHAEVFAFLLESDLPALVGSKAWRALQGPLR